MGMEWYTPGGMQWVWNGSRLVECSGYGMVHAWWNAVGMEWFTPRVTEDIDGHTMA